MTLNRLLITSVVVENRPVRDVANHYGVSESWLFELLARYRTEGDAAFEARSRRPRSVPTTTPTETVELILELREKLTATGLDAGPDTIRWHLEHHHSVAVSRATISRYLTKAGLVAPEPKKKPKSSYIRFQAEMPNETWQADFTHYRLRRPDGRPGAGHRDPDLARRLFPLRPLRHRPPPSHRTDSAGPLPRHRCRARNPCLHTHRQRHGLHHQALPGQEGCRHPQRLRDRAAPSQRGPEERATQPPHHPRQGGTVPADDEEVAPQTGRPTDHNRRPPGPPRPLRRGVQRAPATPLPGPPSHPRNGLHEPPQGDAEHRRPRRRHPPPRPPRQGRQGRQDHLAIPRRDVLHRHRPHPHRNPRHRPRPGPRHPHHRRRHRRTPPRARPRHIQALPRHRTPTRPHTLKTKRAEPTSIGFGPPRCLETSHGRADRI